MVNAENMQKSSTNNEKNTSESIESEMDDIDNADQQGVWKKPSTERLVTGGAWWAIFDFIGSAMAFLMTMILSDADHYHATLFNDINTYQLFFRSFAAIGFVGAGGKFIAEYIGRGDYTSAKEISSATSKYNFLFTGIPTIIFATILMFRFDPVTESYEFACYSLLIVYILFDRLRSCVDINLLGFQRYDIYSFGAMTTHIWGNLIAVFLFQYGAFWGFLSFTIASILSFPIALLGFKKVMKDKNLDWKIADIFNWGRKSKAMFDKMFRFNILFAVANIIFSLLISSLFITMGDVLSIFSGVERLSYTLITAFATFYFGVFGLVNPVTQAISEAHGMRNKKLVKNFFLCVVKFPLLFALAVTGFFIFCGSELISIFYDPKWVILGMFILIVLFPGYALASFASKYDNMLAGVGRPDVPMKPWLIGFLIAVLGILSCLLLPEQFITNNPNLILIETVDGVDNLMNYNLTLRFAVGILSLAIGMFVAGAWIIKITIKVFNIDIPKKIFTQPLFAILGSIGVYLILNLIFSFETLFADDIIYFAVKTVILLLFFILFLFMLGGISRYDARFLRDVIKNIPGGKLIIKIAKPIYSVFERIQIIKPDQTEWISSSAAKTGKKSSSSSSDEIFTVDLNLSYSGDAKKTQLIASNFSTTLYDAVIYARIGEILVEDSISYRKICNPGETVEKDFNLNFEEITTSTKLTKVQFFFEAYEKFSTGEEPLDLINKRFKIKRQDYRMRWSYEKGFLYDLDNKTLIELT